MNGFLGYDQVVNPSSLPQVVIVGAGFGGLSAAQKLGSSRARVTVIDKSNHHLFQPLLYQVATAGLSPADIATPIRSVLSRQLNTDVLLGEVQGVDVARRKVILADRELTYDYLVLATGAQHSYFGRDEWEHLAPGLKRIEDAIKIRRKILMAFELAEAETDEKKRNAYLTFIIVGGGPTGVELAGSIGELAHFALRKDFRHIDPACARVILVEAGPRILSSFPEKLSDRARNALHKLGVEVKTGVRVEAIDEQGVTASGTKIDSKSVIWAAGVMASAAGRWLGTEVDRVGRVVVMPDLTVPGHPEVFVIGDAALVKEDGKALPGIAPVAMQQGRYVGSVIAKKIRSKDNQLVVPPFHYLDKGNLATIGRTYAIADLGKVKLSGFIAWLTWVVVHIYYLIGFRNRILVLIEWAWSYITFKRGARIIASMGPD